MPGTPGRPAPDPAPDLTSGAAPAARMLGVVFAGGQSRRMGEDKALLPWPDPAGGEPLTLLEHAARRLEALGCTVEVARGSGGQAPVEGRPLIVDAAPDAGPLAGLLAALERARAVGASGVLALACDMPLVGAAELRPLVSAVLDPAGEADASMWVVDGREQPLCAAYSTRCLGAARAAFEGGARRPVALFDAAAAGGRAAVLIRLEADENSAARLVNLNTPTDYDRAAADARRSPS